MKKLISLFFYCQITTLAFAQPGPATLAPGNFIKDAENRTVSMQNGVMKNTPVVSHWQLHASGFQPTISLGAGGFYFEYGEFAQYSVVAMNGGNVPQSSMMAPIDLPENAAIQYFEACYFDRSASNPNQTTEDCSIKFSFYRVAAEGCSPEVLGTIVSINSGTPQDVCPIKCSLLTVPGTSSFVVNNKDFFYYVLATSIDENGAVGGNQNCGNWGTAKLGIRGIEIEYALK